ncbi:MAG: SLC13 family permease [Pseudomonadota bacterium]
MPATGLTGDMLLVFAVTAGVIALFLLEWVRVDVVALMVMVLLPVLGLVTASEAFSGLSGNAVVSIMAVMIIGRGLDHTGVINRVVQPLVKLSGDRSTRIVPLLSITVAFISSVMQNVGAAALFLPAIRRISRRSGVPLSRILMPVGFSAILGGTITLVGSSPLIMLNDLMAPFGLKALSLYSVMPAGIALVVTGIVYFVLVGGQVLPKTTEASEAGGEMTPAANYYDQVQALFEIVYPPTGAVAPTVCELCDRFNVHTVALQDPSGRLPLIPPPRNAAVKPGSRIAVYATAESVAAAAREYGFELLSELTVFADALSSDYRGVVEAVVAPHSRFAGQTLHDIHFRHNHLLAPLALFRENHAIYTSLAEQILHPGDAILMHGKWDQFKQFRNRQDLIFSHSLDHEILEPHKAWSAAACFGLATALVIFSSLKLAVCLLAGAVGMILLKVVTIDDAYQSIDWRTVFLLAGLIPLGMAMEKTGAAQWMALEIVDFIGVPSPTLFIFIIGTITTVFTLVVSNVGATVLLVPLVVSLALDVGADPRLAAMVVGLAASNSFMLPTHQVNALYMGPARYRSRDFLKAGAPLTVIYLVVLTAVIRFVY